jgi:hypothetical protein
MTADSDARKRRSPLRLWLGAACGAMSAVLFAMTLVWPDWIERIFEVEPDGGSGATEWGWAIAFGVVALVCLGDAGLAWRRKHRADALPK